MKSLNPVNPADLPEAPDREIEKSIDYSYFCVILFVSFEARFASTVSLPLKRFSLNKNELVWLRISPRRVGAWSVE
jgi:hypothetical protein